MCGLVNHCAMTSRPAAFALLARAACAPAAVTPASLDASSYSTSHADASTVDLRAGDSSSFCVATDTGASAS